MNLVVEGKATSYEVLEILGKGNFGIVNKVKDRKTNEIKALKRVKHSSMKEEPKLKELIQSEIKIMSDLIKLNSKNPNIVKYYEDFEDKNYINIVMEYCDGGDLRKYMQKVKKMKKLPENEVLLIFKDILNGFKDLLKINAIHRDFKPDNIFVHQGTYKIGDFGFGRQSTLANTVLGTGAYMALEIFEANRLHKYDNKVDIWAMAVCTYEMIFGFCPYFGTSDEEIIESIKENNLDFNANSIKISNECKDLLQRMLVVDPKKRINWTEMFNHPWVFDRNKGNTLNNGDILLQSTLGFLEDFSEQNDRYLEERNKISHFIFVIDKGFLAFDDIKYNFGLFAFARFVLYLYKNLIDSLRKKINIFETPNFEDFINSDSYETLTRIIGKDFEDFNEVYQLYYFQLDDLNVDQSNILFANLKKLCNPEQKFNIDVYVDILSRYIGRFNKMIEIDISENSLLMMILEAINWSKAFETLKQTYQKNKIFKYFEYRNKFEQPMEKHKILAYAAEVLKNMENKKNF